MSEWTPATKEEVERAVRLEEETTNPAYWQKRAHMLVDPYPCTFERFGQLEQTCVVAVGPHRVVYFDDVEEIFGPALEQDGRLLDEAMYGSLAVALKEAASGA